MVCESDTIGASTADKCQIRLMVSKDSCHVEQ